MSNIKCQLVFNVVSYHSRLSIHNVTSTSYEFSNVETFKVGWFSVTFDNWQQTLKKIKNNYFIAEIHYSYKTFIYKLYNKLYII